MNDTPLPDVSPRTLPLRSSEVRRAINRTFAVACVVTASMSLVVLAVLLSAILVQGFGRLNLGFLTSAPDPDPDVAGIGPALLGTIWVCFACALLTLPIGIATAVFLEEFKPRGPITRRLHGFLQLNIANLAGVPSVVYGIIGLTAFVYMFGIVSSGEPAFEFGVRYYDQFITEGQLVVLVPVDGRKAPKTKLVDGMQAQTVIGRKVTLIVPGPRPKKVLEKDPEKLKYTLYSDVDQGRIDEKAWYYVQLPFGRGVLAGALTLMLVVLPIVIISSQEALRAVPDSLRAGALGMGATRWQTVWNITLPAALPGIMTGAILAMSRAIGETAPILIISPTLYIASGPGNLMDKFTVMPFQIYNWARLPDDDVWDPVAASGIIVLLSLLLVFNTVAVVIRHRMQKQTT